MQAAVDLEYAYRYRGESALISTPEETRLALVTTAAAASNAQYLKGSILSPKRTADLFMAVVDVVESRFHIPAAMLAKILRQSDPVITCSREECRFEGFSACCGAYVRLDLLGNAVDGTRFDTGTTNVNFNAPMRSALSRVRDGDPMDVEIGTDVISVNAGGAAVVERKVTLPSRWLRGFADVQAVQAGMRLRFELPGSEFRRWLRELPRGIKGSAWVSSTNGAMRISSRSSPGAVAVGGIGRLRVLDPVVRHIDRVRVYSPVRVTEDGTTESAWELETPDSRFTLVLSPEVWRGFSGEGQLLETLAKPDADRAMAAVKASLRWQEIVDVDDICAMYGVAEDDVVTALARCAATGLVGYDLSRNAYFHRELPFNMADIPKLQPRLKAARALADQSAISIESRIDPVKAWVRSRDVEYRVVIEDDSARCTCVWFAKHNGSRGPCKHILAVKMALETSTNAD